MKTITVTAAGDDERLSEHDWRDLLWLLGVIEDWLLYAEPSTIVELSRSLQSVGSTATPPQVVKRLGELRRRVIDCTQR